MIFKTFSVSSLWRIFFLCSLLTSLVYSKNITDSIFEGDIIADYETISKVYDEKLVNELIKDGVIEEKVSLRGTSPQYNLWNTNMNQDDLFLIRVYIDPEYTSDEYMKIKKAIKRLAKFSGVVWFNFPMSKPSGPFLHIQGRTSGFCASYVGRKNLATSGQPIYLDYRCLIRGTIQHETMHALGFWHEQSRPDRDQHVSIDWSNIQQGKEHNFAKQLSEIDSLGAPYDYDSVMHYHSRAFSANGAETIVVPGDHFIGQRNDLSYGDRLQLRLLYQCTFGPRNYASYLAEPCNTSTCQCARNQKGCGSDDNKCKGSMECRNNRCKVPVEAWDYVP